MIRRAFIIAAPGQPDTDNYLSGVLQDSYNYSHFLRSPTGGAWSDIEIIQLYSPSRDELFRILRHTSATYSLIIFSGHGGTDSATGEVWLQINPQERVSLSALVTRAHQQLVLLDSCRTVVPGLAGVVEEVKQFLSNLTPTEARELFEQYLEQCEGGRVVGYSCQYDQESVDTVAGGCFSLALLDSINHWVSMPSAEAVLPVSKAITYSQQQLENITKQQPHFQSIPYNRQRWFPLAVRQPLQVL